MTSQNEITQLESAAQIYQWTAEIFSCFGPFTVLPDSKFWNIHPDIEHQFKTLESLIQSELEHISSAKLENTLATEGTSYFEASQEGVPLPLYGSWWLDGELYGETTHQVAQIMRAEEIETTVEVADYLPTELEFISLLILLEVEGHKRNEDALIQKGKDLRSSFVHQFLRPWIADFEKKSHETVESVYWKTVIMILVVLIRNDF